MAVGVLVPAAPALAAPEPPFTEGQIFSLPYHAEPDFLLVTGQDRWSVRNRPTGTVVAAYGHPDDSTHDAYMGSARYNPIDAGTSGTLIDVTTLVADPARGREHSWNVATYDDHVELWGPVDQPAQDAYRMSLSGHTVAGAMVVSDHPSPTRPGYIEPAAVVMVDTTGGLWRYDYSTPDGVESLGQVDDSFGAGSTVLAAVGRSWSDVGGSAEQCCAEFIGDGTQPRSGWTVGSTAPSGSEFMVVLLDNGEVVPVEVTSDTATVLPALSTIDPTLAFDPAALPIDEPVLIDADYTCTQAQVLSGSTGDGYTISGDPTGPVATLLSCPQGHDEGIFEVMSAGRLSVGVGTSGSAGSAVEVITAADAATSTSDGKVLHASSDHRHDTACNLAGTGAFTPGHSDDARPGSFDVRVAHSVTHVACGYSRSIGIGTLTYVQPKERFLINGAGGAADPALREPVTNSQSAFVERRTLDRLAQPGPDEAVEELPILTESYDNIRDVTVALQFPCESLLPRPLGQGGFLEKCVGAATTYPDGSQAVQPANQVTITTAGYATVDGAPRAFINNHPHEQILSDEVTTSGRPDSAANPYSYAFTTEPSPYFASDLERLRTNLGSGDFEFVDPFEPADAPPMFISHVPGRGMTEVRIKILDPKPERRTTPVKPIAVLQAPPTVSGLGQQTTFTPEFAETESQGNSSANSIAARVGTHFGIEATLVVGAGILGNNSRVGGGAAFDFGFMSEVEETFEEGLLVEKTEGYGGSFADHTIVTDSVIQDIYRAEVIEDGSGLAVGDEFELKIPRGSLRSARPLTRLAEEEPALYGTDGLFRQSLDRMLVGDIGDPGSYRRGANEAEPTSLSGPTGPCKGGYTPDIDSRTPQDGYLPPLLNVKNPFISSDPEAPIGPSILVSQPHVVSVGDDLTESATIAVTESTTASLATTESYDFAVTGIFKASAESDATVSSQFELTVSAGVDGGFSNGAGVTNEIGSGSTLAAVMGNIPHDAPDTDHWLNDETYVWRMFMCKAPFGPAGLGTDIFVQGYVVDDYSENASGGIEDLTPLEVTSPTQSAVVRAEVGEALANPVDCPDVPGTDRNSFRWKQDSGTLSRQTIVVENVSEGGRVEIEVAANSTPLEAKAVGRRDCVDVAAQHFTDGDLYRWQPTAEGFLGDDQDGDWEFFRPQVWPPDQTLHVREPIVNPDATVTIDIDDPAEVRSLRHDVDVYRIDAGGRNRVAGRTSVSTGRYRTPSLEPGHYEVDVVGFNSHMHDGGARAETPIARVQFNVADELTAQFAFNCDDDPCTTAEAVAFTDETLLADDVPITSWSWFFGDGSTSSEQHPTHRFMDLPSDGSNGYDVFLTVTDALGRTSSFQDRVLLRGAAPVIGPCEAEHPEAGAFVRAVLSDFLSSVAENRVEPLCLASLDADGRLATATSIAFSRDYVAETVDASYHTYLGRSADAGGLDYWVDKVVGGELTPIQVAAQIASSDEAVARAGGTIEAWVAKLYRTVLGRQPDAEGAAWWADSARASGRHVVAQSILDSEESLTVRVQRSYLRFLGRPADNGGLDYWTHYLRMTGNDISLSINHTTSAEYLTRATRRF